MSFLTESRLGSKWLPAAAFVAAVAFAAPYPLIRLSLTGAAPVHDALAAQADPWPPELTQFLDGVRARTKNGESIALLMPVRTWDDGYAYIYYRSSYILAGRIVVPVLDSQNRLHPERLQDADWVAAWHVAPPQSSGAVAFSGGVLAGHGR